MNARLVSLRIPTALALTALTLALTACGNKGPLVLPTQPAPQEAPRAKPGEVPVTISNANDPPVAVEPKAKTSLPSPPLENMLPVPAQGKDGESKDADGKTKPAQDGEKTQDGSGDGSKPAEPVPTGQSHG
ncbi:LPS translocon maturation chaperone LptM [Pseudomonas sp. CGJS7]|uniref:LPS translocon maturation chaperone LptM n=1 Tax=Pseudomonas sp. CGJS7 TaxID=3109348 RepID=UPI00300BC238